MMRSLGLLVFLSALGLSPATPAQGSSPRPVVRMTQMTVEVAIRDGVASTTLRQTWRNDGRADAESVWILPLPSGAVADGFTMTMNGVPTAGEVLGADAAREVYEGIVRKKRDPGLLEYFGRGCLRARIFPIPPQGEVVVDVGFRAVLPELLGLRQWSFALGAAGSEGQAPERIVLDLHIQSKKPIKNAYAPLNAIQVIQKGEHEVRASFEGWPAQLTQNELAVFYGLSEAEFGLDLLAHMEPGGSEGTFLMLISPKREWQRTETLQKSIVFVLDTSGSMEGKKIDQARNALKLFLQSLSPGDRFDVVPFATEPEPFFGERVPASSERVAEALARVERITAAGGTNIDGALAAALANQGELDGRVPIVVFLTDGEPTVGETAPEKILAAVRDENAGKARLFVLGVGSNLNTHLLDTLAAQNGGARDYVREEERIDEKTRALFAKLAHPVMTDLQLSIDGLRPTQLVPERLPDLFAGDRIELFGRYEESGARAIRLSGVVSGVRREYVYEGTFASDATGGNAFLAPLWAERRVGVLLDAIRLNGANPELVSEVERLGRKYRIVTPYTSHLVLEPGLRVAGGSGGTYRGPLDTVPPGGSRPATRGGPGSPGTGGGANDGYFLGHGRRADNEGIEEHLRELSRLGILPVSTSEEELAQVADRVVQELRDSEESLRALGYAGVSGKAVGEEAVANSQYLERLMSGRSRGGSSLLELFSRRVQDKIFVLCNGVWTDEALREALPPGRRTVEAFSPEYFALLVAEPRLAPYLAFSSHLIVGWKGDVYEIVEPAPVPAPPASR